MLSKPWCGWTQVIINNEKLGSASYLDWVPGLVLDPCIRYLTACTESQNNYDFIGGGYGFNIEFDAEGYNFGLVEIGNNLYSYDTCADKEPYINLKEIDLSEYNYNCYEFIYTLTKEVISDLETNYEDWILWDTMTNDKEEYDKNKEALDEIINKAKVIVEQFDNSRPKSNMELGNLLFGNSRGEFPILDREIWQDTFWKYFDIDEFDYHCYYMKSEDDPDHTTDRGGYKNDVFTINPYYWGEDENIMSEPNFIYKPTGLEIQWYKYPFRDAYLNQDISLDEAKKIWEDCIKSMEVK